jgi:hypothetical protein
VTIILKWKLKKYGVRKYNGSGQGPVACSCEYANASSSSMKAENLLTSKEMFHGVSLIC